MLTGVVILVDFIVVLTYRTHPPCDMRIAPMPGHCHPGTIPEKEAFYVDYTGVLPLYLSTTDKT